MIVTGTLYVSGVDIKVVDIKKAGRSFKRTEVVLRDPDGNEHTLIAGDTLNIKVVAKMDE